MMLKRSAAKEAEVDKADAMLMLLRVWGALLALICAFGYLFFLGSFGPAGHLLNIATVLALLMPLLPRDTFRNKAISRFCLVIIVAGGSYIAYKFFRELSDEVEYVKLVVFVTMIVILLRVFRSSHD